MISIHEFIFRYTLQITLYKFIPSYLHPSYSNLCLILYNYIIHKRFPANFRNDILTLLYSMYIAKYCNNQ